MIDQFGMNKVTEFAEMVSFMHNVLYQEAIANGRDEPTEHKFEHDWWKDKHEELKSVTV
jgi:hypothetical protein